ncbi:MAG: tRNA pseudouridine(13) synthase TruD [Planctomycetota bacterium]
MSDTPSDNGAWIDDAPHATPELPGIGGRIKQRPEDFLVEEIPLEDPSGDGDYLYIFVEKEGMAATDMLRVLERHFDVEREDLGWAGMKDKVGITRQVISVFAPDKDETDFPELRHDRVRILWTDRHDSQLPIGHLRGNRFSIKVRGVHATDVLGAQRIMARLGAHGAPNLFGTQRFGRRMNNHRIGAALLMGEWERALAGLLGFRDGLLDSHPDARRLFEEGAYERALDAFPKACVPERKALQALVRGKGPKAGIERVGLTQRRFWVSAFQSAVFNRVVAQRLERGTWNSLLEGDVAYDHDSGAIFPVDQERLENPMIQERVESVSVSPTAPLWGRKMVRAAGRTFDDEWDALTETGVTLDHLQQHGPLLGQSLNGVRRPTRMRVVEPDVEGGADEHGEYVRCAFELASGCYATMVMREVMKVPATLADKRLKNA